MTILPKKKQAQSRSDSETSSESSSLQHISVTNSTHLSHIGPGSQVAEPLQSRLASRTSSGHSHVHGHSSQSSSRYDDYDLESGPSHSKRRMRVSPHRSIRPKHRDRSERAPSTTAIPSTSTSVLSCQPSSSSGSSPTPSHSGTEPSSSYHVEGEPGNGYNSGDEYGSAISISEEEWEQKERWFEKKMRKRGFIIKRMGEDGACLFRAVSDQVYGDQEMHSTVRKHCMDYIAANGDYFSQYMTEDFTSYVNRKRSENVHGNHIEMQAMSEMYNRQIEVFCYSVEPINIFNGGCQSDNEPIRLSYHRGVHYNSLVDPYKATIGVGLGLPGFVPGGADKKLLCDAMSQSEETLIEQAMLEDKVKATDWEATNEAIEEQVARESYLEWLRENDRRSRQQRAGHSAATSSTNADLRSPRLSTTGTPSSARNSPKPSILEHQRKSPNASPKACGSRDGTSASPHRSPAAGTSSVTGTTSKKDWGLGPGFELTETASFLGQLPPDMFGLADWEDAGLLAQVLAASQQEYLDNLKKSREGVVETTHNVDFGSRQQQPTNDQGQNVMKTVAPDIASEDLRATTTSNGANNS